WRARDTTLGRDVAIKVLPATFASDPDRLRRFEQEAQAAGALNHPNILVIYHVGTHEGAPYIVSELLEGETLRERIDGVALPQRKAIDFALQTAHGLAAAHEKGIVHRDLKPENLFITKDGRLKILDFGLAKLTERDSGEAQTNIPTRKVDTEPGVIMGTLGYMSPEQVRGRAVDHRSDIFSFGAILYEMLSGKRAFHGDSAADVMSAILREDPPDLSATNKMLAPALERVIDHCLEKNPEERFHSASDLAFAIEALSGTAVMSGSTFIADLPPARRRYREMAAWVTAGLLLLGCTALAALYFRQPPNDQRPVSFVIAMPEKVTEIASPVISPDGRTIAFLGATEGRRYLYLRNLDSVAVQRLAGTDDAFLPFWSPDNRYIGFFSNNKLKKIEVTGGPAQNLCTAPSATGGAWNRDGVIVFGMQGKGLHRVSASGGEPALLLPVEESRKEAEHAFPSFLPDGKHFLYYSWNGSESTAETFVASLDGGVRKKLMVNDSNAVYVSPGYLLFARASTLMAQAFNAYKLEFAGEPFPVMENVSFTANIAHSNFSVSESGALVFWSSTTSGRQLAWFDRAGKQISLIGPPADYNDVMLSPDDKRAAVQRLDAGNSDIWLIDLVRGVPTRFTFNASSEDNPAWSPDGNTLLFSSGKDGPSRIYKKVSSGAGNEELVGDTPEVNDDGIDQSPDGKFVLFETIGTNTGPDLWILPLSGDTTPRALLATEFREQHGRFSPDGRWFAYVSDESGRPEVYVQSYPLGGGKWQISSGGGAQPHWR
ncbi:MAG: protein kinase, partial [Pyrinomonadaceae bacterium]